MDTPEQRFGEWRADELEGHLHEQVSDREAVGLTPEGAFSIAVGRLGRMDLVTAEFARESGERLWKQLATPSRGEGGHRLITIMLAFAGLAAVLIQVARILAPTAGSSRNSVVASHSGCSREKSNASCPWTIMAPPTTPGNTARPATRPRTGPGRAGEPGDVAPPRRARAPW